MGAIVDINRLGALLGPYDLYQVTTRPIRRAEVVEEPVAKTRAATLAPAGDQKRNEALRGLGRMIDAHEKSMKKESTIMTTTEKVEDTKDALEDLQ